MAVDRKCKICGNGFRVYGQRAGRAGFYCSRACKGIASRLIGACERCGKAINVTGRGVDGRRRFCSRACSGASRMVRKSIPCGVCGTATLEPQRFCSHACASIYQGRQKVALTCVICGKGFRWSASRLKRAAGRYCSIECRTACPSWRRNAAIEGNLIQCRRRTPNKLEVAGEALLAGLGASYDTQVLIDEKFVVDAYVPALRLVVQWDGDYWHGYRAGGDARPLDERQQKRQKFDRSQDAYMAKHGYLVARYWEHDVRDRPEWVQADIARRMELAVQPTKRAAVAKSKNKLDKAEDLPLFGGAE